MSVSSADARRGEPRRWVAGAVGRLAAASGSVPPAALVLLGLLSAQFGSATAKGLFGVAGLGGTVFLRAFFAAVVLWALCRPRLRGRSRADWLLVVLFGAVLAGMTLCFYAALARVPLGVAVTLEFVGPLGVAVLGSRRRMDLAWVASSGCGILLLAPWGALGGSGVDPVGAALAVLAGGFWASYILLGPRLGRSFGSGDGLALSMCVAALLLAPIGLREGMSAALDPRWLLAALAMAVLSSAVPYSLELAALRGGCPLTRSGY